MVQPLISYEIVGRISYIAISTELADMEEELDETHRCVVSTLITLTLPPNVPIRY